jgi:tetratricopeptide (TPR) repeat protein
MTNDELLAGFLDRSLTEDELLEFEALRSAQPEFAQSVDKMLTVEGLLAKGAPRVAIPTEFLNGVEQAVSAKIVSGAAATTAGSFAGLSGSTIAWIAGAGAALVGATAIYLSTQSSTKEELSAPAKPTVELRSSEPEFQAKSAQPSGNPSVVAMPSSSINRQPSISAAPAAVTQERQARVVRPDDADATTHNPNRALDNLLRDFELCKLQHDNVRCAQISLAIGRTLLQNGNNTGSLEYLTQSLQFAKNSRIVKYQIDALGELGLVNLNMGRTGDARKMLQEAVTLGNANGVAVDRWTKLLNDL